MEWQQRLDTYHSFANLDDVVTKHVLLRLKLDVHSRALSGEAILQMQSGEQGATFVCLDTRELDVSAVEVNYDKVSWRWDGAAENEALGRCLRIELPERLHKAGISFAVLVRFASANPPAGLDYLQPQQTRSQRCHFVYSQFQCILARTCFPCQDTPAVKAPYQLELTVPEPMVVVCSAPPGTRQEEPGVEAGTRVFKFQQPVPVPSYLIAFAAGDFTLQELSPRTYAWCENVPELKQKVKEVLAPMELNLAGLEEICGVPYVWGSYGVCVMPASFPYGGMENPNCTFMNESLLDPELFDVVQHEMAHSWSGNLVTNKLHKDFWLNEGFTMYLERAIQFHMYGSQVTTMYALFGHGELQRDVNGLFEDKPNWTKLRPDLAGQDPDDAFSRVPYEKGFQFLMYLQDLVGGRYTFTAWVQTYFQRFQYQSVTAEEMRAHFEETFPLQAAQVDWDGWFYGIGMPAWRLEDYLGKAGVEDVEHLVKHWQHAADPTKGLKEGGLSWHCYKTMVFLDELRNSPLPLSVERLQKMDQLYRLGETNNPEVLHKWLLLCITKGGLSLIKSTCLPRFVSRFGRGIYIKDSSCGVFPVLWRHATSNPNPGITLDEIKSLMDSNKDFYHPVVWAALERLRSSPATQASELQTNGVEAKKDVDKPETRNAAVVSNLTACEEKARAIFDRDTLCWLFSDPKELATARAAVFEQNFQGVAENKPLFYRLLNLGAAYQSLGRFFSRSYLEDLQLSLKDAGDLDADGILNKCDVMVLKHATLISDAYHGYYLAWRQAMHEPRVVEILESDPPPKGSPLYNHYTVIVLDEESGGHKKRRTESGGVKGRLTDVPYATYFARALRPILRRIDALLEDLESLQAESPKYKVACGRYLAYMRQMRTCLSETRRDQLEAAWTRLDELWVSELPPSKVPLQLVHDIEYGYCDPLEVKVAPEFSMRILDPGYANQSSRISSIQSHMVRYFETRKTPLAENGLSALRGTHAGLYKVLFPCGACLHFRMMGQSIPNRSAVKGQFGAKIYFDPLTASFRQKQVKELIRRVFEPAAAEELCNLLDPVGEVVDLTGPHEIGHVIYPLEAINKIFTTPSVESLLEEPRAEMAAIFSLWLRFKAGELKEEELTKLVTIFALGDLRRFACFTSTTTYAYTLSALSTWRTYERHGFMELVTGADGAKVLRRKPQNVKPVVEEISAQFEQLLDLMDKKDAAGIEAMLERHKEESAMTRWLVKQLGGSP